MWLCPVVFSYSSKESPFVLRAQLKWEKIFFFFPCLCHPTSCQRLLGVSAFIKFIFILFYFIFILFYFFPIHYKLTPILQVILWSSLLWIRQFALCVYYEARQSTFLLVLWKLIRIQQNSLVFYNLGYHFCSLDQLHYIDLNFRWGIPYIRRPHPTFFPFFPVFHSRFFLFIFLFFFSVILTPPSRGSKKEPLWTLGEVFHTLGHPTPLFSLFFPVFHSRFFLFIFLFFFSFILTPPSRGSKKEPLWTLGKVFHTLGDPTPLFSLFSPLCFILDFFLFIFFFFLQSCWRPLLEGPKRRLYGLDLGNEMSYL